MIKSALPSLDEAKQSLIEIYQEGYPAMALGWFTKFPVAVNPFLSVAAIAGGAASLAFDHFTSGDLGNDISYLFENFDKLKEKSEKVYQNNRALYDQFIEKMKYIDWILFHYFNGRLKQIASSKQMLTPEDIQTFDKLFKTALELFPIGEQEGGNLAKKVKSALLTERGLLGQGVSYVSGILGLGGDLLATTGLASNVDTVIAFLDRVSEGIKKPLEEAYKTYTDMLITVQQQIESITAKQKERVSSIEDDVEDTEKSKSSIKENIPKGGLSEVGKGILSKLSQ